MRSPLALFFAVLTGLSIYPFEDWKNEMKEVNCAFYDDESCSSTTPIWETILLFPESLMSGDTAVIPEEPPEWWQTWWDAVTLPTNISSDWIRIMADHRYTITNTIEDLRHNVSAIIHDTWKGWAETMLDTYENICTGYKHAKELFWTSTQAAMGVLVTWSDGVTAAALSTTHFLSDGLVYVQELLSDHLYDVYGPFIHAFGHGVAFCIDYRSFLVPYKNLFWLLVAIIACVFIVKKFRAHHKPRNIRPRRNAKGIALKRSMKRDLEITEHTFQNGSTSEQPSDRQALNRAQRRRRYKMANQQWLSPQQFDVFYDSDGESSPPHVGSLANQNPVSPEHYEYLTEQRNHVQSNTDMQEYPSCSLEHQIYNGTRTTAIHQDQGSSRGTCHHDKQYESAENGHGYELFDDSMVGQEREGINNRMFSDGFDVFEDAITDITEDAITDLTNNDEFWNDEAVSKQFNYTEYYFDPNRAAHRRVTFNDNPEEILVDESNDISEGSSFDSSEHSTVFQEESLFANNNLQENVALAGRTENLDSLNSENLNLFGPNNRNRVLEDIPSVSCASGSNENEYETQQTNDNSAAFDTESRYITLDNALSENNGCPIATGICDVRNESPLVIRADAILGNYDRSSKPCHHNVATEVNPMQDACTSTSFESDIEEESDTVYKHGSYAQDSEHDIVEKECHALEENSKDRLTVMTGKVENISKQILLPPEFEDNIRKPYNVVDSNQSHVSSKQCSESKEIYTAFDECFTAFDECIPTLESPTNTETFSVKEDCEEYMDDSNVFKSINPTKNSTLEQSTNGSQSKYQNCESDGSLYFSPTSSPVAGLHRQNRPVSELDASMGSDIGRPWYSSSFQDEPQYYVGSRRLETGDGPLIVTRRSPHREQGISLLEESTISNTDETSLLDVSDINRSLSFNSGDGVFEFMVMFTVQSAYRLTKRLWQDQQPERKVVNISGGDGIASTGDVFIIPSPRKPSKRRYNRRNRSANATELDISGHSSYRSAPEATMDTSFTSAAEELCELRSEDCRFSHSSRASWKSAASRLNNDTTGFFSDRYCTFPINSLSHQNRLQGLGNDRTVDDENTSETNTMQSRLDNESRRRVLDYLDGLNKDSSMCGPANITSPDISVHAASGDVTSGHTKVCSTPHGSKSDSFDNVNMERAKTQQCTYERGQFPLDLDGYSSDSVD